jgi:hypothetical protein
LHSGTKSQTENPKQLLLRLNEVRWWDILVYVSLSSTVDLIIQEHKNAVKNPMCGHIVGLAKKRQAPLSFREGFL